MGRYDEIGTYVSHIYGNNRTYNIDTENVAIKFIESNKGMPLTPITVNSNEEMFKALGVRDELFFKCSNNSPLTVIRINGYSDFNEVENSEGLSISSTQVIEIDDPDNKITDSIIFAGKMPGSFEIKFSQVTSSDGVLKLVFKADGFEEETWRAEDLITLLKSIVNGSAFIDILDVNSKRIHTPSQIDELIPIDISELDKVSLPTVVETQLGTYGTETETKIGNDGTAVIDSNRSSLYRKALQYIEEIFDPQPAVLFTNSYDIGVYAEIQDHVNNMNKEQAGKWRLSLFGASPDDTISQRISKAKSYAKETIWFVGHSLIGFDGIVYKAHQLTSAIAGAIVKTPYYRPLWGGKQDKVLSNLNPFFKNVEEKLNTFQRNSLTQNGVITFVKDKYGIKIYKTVTTATAEKSETEAHEGTGVRVVMKAKRLMKEALDDLSGEMMDDIIDSEIKTACGLKLDTMVDDGALIPFPAENIPAYEIEVNPIPKTAQRDVGRAEVEGFLSMARPLEQTKAKLIVD